MNGAGDGAQSERTEYAADIRSVRILPTTHSLGQLARAVVGPRLPPYVHAYFHDYDLLDAKRRTALVVSLRVLGRRAVPADPLALAHPPDDLDERG